MAPQNSQKVQDLTEPQLAKIRSLRIFFGHQSVGENILEGMVKLQNKYPAIRLQIVKAQNISPQSSSFFVHAYVGRNGDPLAKLDDFARLLKSGIGDKLDVAFVKFCYIDFDERTDVAGLFNKYKRVFQQLKTDFPQTTFIHWTVPLIGEPEGFVNTAKRLVKRLLGRPYLKVELNGPREEFNRLLREEYHDKAPLFDIALLESTLPNGQRLTLEKAGRQYFAMLPGYTYDGGHLSGLGKKVLAEQLLLLLSNLAGGLNKELGGATQQ